MPSHGERIARDLRLLHNLAERLFDLLFTEYQPTRSVTLRLTACDAVANNPHCYDPIVRTVVVAQLLWFATRDPGAARPHQVAGLGLFADDLIATLLAERSPNRTGTAQQLHEIRGEMDNLCMNLMVSADPGMPDFLRG